MLSSVLNSLRAIEVNIRIIHIFTKIRESFKDNLILKFVIRNNLGLIIKKALVFSIGKTILVIDYFYFFTILPPNNFLLFSDKV